MKKISSPLTGSLLILSLIVGIGIGYYLTPEYQMTMFQDQNMDLGSADQLVDLRYLNRMIAHHQLAIELAKQAEKNATRTELTELSRDIQANEPALIETLYQYKKDFYKDSRKVTTPRVPYLGNLDPTFDLRFLNALISHHKEGILMAKELQTKSTRTEIMADAMAVEAFLTDSLVTLEKYRNEWYPR